MLNRKDQFDICPEKEIILFEPTCPVEKTEAMIFWTGNILALGV